MSFLKKVLGDLVEFEEKAPSSVDASKPLSNQINENTGGFQVFTPSMQTPVQTGTVATISADHLSEEDRTKLDKYFSELYESANCPKPSYHEFMMIVQAFQGVAEDMRFKGALGSFGGKLTKDVLLHTANDTLNLVRKDLEDYNKVVNEKLNTEVSAKKLELKKLQEQLATLQQNIHNLSLDIHKSEKEIEQKLAGYNLYSNNIQNKIQKDINDIQMYV